MSRVFMFLLGKGKDELEAMLKSVEKKLETDPENELLIEERDAIKVAILECEK